MIASALNPKSIWGLFRSGFSTLRGALVMPLMIRGQRKGLIKFGLISAVKAAAGKAVAGQVTDTLKGSSLIAGYRAGSAGAPAVDDTTPVEPAAASTPTTLETTEAPAAVAEAEVAEAGAAEAAAVAEA